MHLEDNSPTLAELTEVQRKQAMARFRILRSHMEREFRFREQPTRPASVCEP